MLFEKIKLEEDETLIEVVRKHWFIIAVETAMIALFAVLPALIISLLFLFEPLGVVISYQTIGDILRTYQAHVTFLYTAWLLVLWIILSNYWTDYYLDLWAITTRRVVLVDQRGFFRRFISSFRLERLQDMNIEVNGIFATLLDYGTIEAQTAGGSNEEFISHSMPKPRDIKATVVGAADELIASQATRITTLKEQGL